MAQPFIVDFPVNDLLLPYKEQLIEEFYEQIKTKTDPGYSRKVHIEPVLNIIKPLWVEKIKYHFDPLPLSQPEFKVWLYVQNNTNIDAYGITILKLNLILFFILMFLKKEVS